MEPSEEASRLRKSKEGVGERGFGEFGVGEIGFGEFGVGEIGDGVGAKRVPSSGIPAGCPLATFIMSLVVMPWRVAVRTVPRSFARSWVCRQ